MGWNSWNNFHCKINETLIRSTADSMIKYGFLNAGYKYLNLDDCWSSPHRNSTGYLMPDPKT
ncbi:8515_t:CDS:2, partial [Scutellospora calospora]